MSPRICYSYVRFSHSSQALGDSLRRQMGLAEEYCRRRGWTLSDKTFRDLGVSAFRGKNALVGNLGEFLRAVEMGSVKKGSALLVESLDRISRQGIDEGYELVKKILKAGIILVTLSPERDFDLSATKSLSKGALEIQLILERAAEESERKSERIKAAWAGKRIKAREGTDLIAGSPPAWIRKHSGKLELIPEKVKAVRRIFQLAAAGYGRFRIVQTLKAEGFGEWAGSSVSFILTDRRALGIYQPRKTGRIPDGEPIANYYPAAVSEKEWLAARAGMAQRRRKLGGVQGRKWQPEEDNLVKNLDLSVGVIARRLRRTRAAVYQRRLHLGITTKQNRDDSNNFVNVFSGLIKNARPPHDSYIVASRMEASGPTKALLNAGHAEGKSKCFLFQLEPFERAVLWALREIDPRDILPPRDDPETDPLAELHSDLAGIDAELAEATAFMESNGFSATIGKRISALETRKAELKAELLDVQAKQACPASVAWAEYGNLLSVLEKVPDPRDARLRLRAALHRIVERIWLLVVPVPGKRERLAFTQIHFRDSSLKRLYAILYHPGIGNQHHLKAARFWTLNLDTEKAGPLAEVSPQEAEKLAATVKKIVEARVKGQKIEVVESPRGNKIATATIR